MEKFNERDVGHKISVGRICVSVTRVLVSGVGCSCRLIKVRWRYEWVRTESIVLILSILGLGAGDEKVSKYHLYRHSIFVLGYLM